MELRKGEIERESKEVKEGKDCSFFFLPYSTTIKEIHLQYKGSRFIYPCSINVDIVVPPIDKAIYSHRYSIVPVVFVYNRPEYEDITKRLTKHSKVSCSLSPMNRSIPFPLNASLPFTYKDTPLTKVLPVYWTPLPIAKITYTTETVTVKALREKIVIKGVNDAGNTIKGVIEGNIPTDTSNQIDESLSTSTILSSNTIISFNRNTLKKIFWRLIEGDKKGQLVVDSGW